MDELRFNIDGQDYLRVRCTARMRLAQGNEVPGQIHQALAAKKEIKPYWVDPDNPDLVWVNFILDSEGDNLNFDYMPRSQLLASYKTARFKPMDMEHVIAEGSSMIYMDKSNPPVKNTIFGVMSHAYLSDANGNALTDKQIKAAATLSDEPSRPMKDRVTVSAWAGLYYFLFPQTVKDMVKSIANDSMKVSMERWLKDWDFMIGDGDTWETVARAEAEKTGVFDKWQRRQMVNGKKILRRTLKYSYGGVGSTTNPANLVSRFIEKSATDAAKAAASRNDPAAKLILARHDQVVREFAVSSDEVAKATLAAEHESLHRAMRVLGVA